MKKLLLILLCLPMIGFGQNVNIPDYWFKQYLIGNTGGNSLINTNGDSEIQVSEAAVFNGEINVTSYNIYDLTGIEAFTALMKLYVLGNPLTSLDVSSNLALTEMQCDGNNLTSFDVGANVALTDLSCSENQLTSLDVSGATALTSLFCYNNLLTSLDFNVALVALFCSGNLLSNLDVSNNTALTILDCQSNQLTSLDVRNGNNMNMAFFNTTNNPNLTCINVDDVAYSNTNWTDIDPQHYFSTNCSGTSIQEQTKDKTLLKVTDLLGRETKQTNQPLFYIYDDGTVEKRIVIE